MNKLILLAFVAAAGLGVGGCACDEPEEVAPTSYPYGTK